MADNDDNERPIVLDCGSGMCKVGFAGDKLPRAVFPNIVGRPHHSRMIGKRKNEVFVGDDADSRRGILDVNCPSEQGNVSNWDDLENIWRHAFYNKLRVAPEEHPLLLSVIPFKRKDTLEKIAQIMFETFNFPALYFSTSVVLSLHACGRTTGIVLECGDSVTNIFPVCEGYAVSLDIQSINMGGSDITDYWMKLLNHRGCSFSNSSDRKVVRDIKEKLAYVALDYNGELYNSSDSKVMTDYELPDGQVITIGDERFKCPEILFQPYLVGMKNPGIQEATYDTIMKCGEDLRKAMYGNIVLSGGSTMFPGMADRLTKEISELLPGKTEVKVEAHRNREYMAWIGGSILASLLNTFRQPWISKEEYDNCGPSVVHRQRF